jgi:excisionase family DNA binding protein
LLRVPEVARQLGIDGTEVYVLIERGELEAGRGEDGLVYVRADALDAYRVRRTTAAN